MNKIVYNVVLVIIAFGPDFFNTFVQEKCIWQPCWPGEGVVESVITMLAGGGVKIGLIKHQLIYEWPLRMMKQS